MEKLITTKELAEMLGVSERTVKDTAKSKGMEINFHPLQTKGGIQKVMMFNEKQATAIKIELQNHTKISKNGFSTLDISNDIEMIVVQQKLQAYQSMRIAQLEAENKIMLPKAQYYDDFINSENLVEIGHLGKLTGIGEKKIFKLLIGDDVIRKKFVDGITYYESNYRYDKFF